MLRSLEHEHTILTPTEASQGAKLGHMRYVLGFSLTLAVAAGIMLLLTSMT